MKTRKVIAVITVMAMVLVTLCGCMKVNSSITFKADGETVDVGVSMFYSEQFFEMSETTPEAYFAEQEISMDQVKTKTIDGELYYGIEEHAEGPISSIEDEPVLPESSDAELGDTAEVEYEFYEEGGKKLIKITMVVAEDTESDEDTRAITSAMIEMKVIYTFENGLKSAAASDPSVLEICGNTVSVDAYPREKNNIITIVGILGDAEKTSEGGDTGETEGEIPAETTETEASVFSDVAADAYYADAVAWAYENKVTSGMGNGKFGSDVECSRAQVVTFLWNAAGQPEPETAENPFTDVKDPDAEDTDWFSKAVLWAVENGITSGTSATTFDPTATCKNSHILTFLWNSLGQPGKTDMYEGKQWYDDAFNWAKSRGLIDGVPGADDLTKPCPRKNIVTFMYRNSLAE